MFINFVITLISHGDKNISMRKFGYNFISFFILLFYIKWIASERKQMYLHLCSPYSAYHSLCTVSIRDKN